MGRSQRFEGAAALVLSAACLVPVACAERASAASASRPADRGSQGAAQRLYALPPVTDPEKLGLGFFSHAEAGQGHNYEHAEDFVLEGDASLLAVKVWAMPVGAQSLASFERFAVRVYGHAPGSEGQVGELIAQRWLTPRAVKIRATGRRGSGQDEAVATPEFTVELAFAEPVALEGGRRYFVSVVAQRGDPAVHFQWQDAVTRDSVAYSRPLEASREGWIAVADVDSAFELWGRPKPTPSTAMSES